MDEATERWYPSTLGLLCGLVFLGLHAKWPFDLPPTLKELFQAGINISAIGIGFLTTAYSILLALEDTRPVIKYLKQADVYTHLLQYLQVAIMLSFGTALASSLVLVFDESRSAGWYVIGFSGWIFLTVTTLFACHRVIYLFAKVLRAKP
jgi:hypothetical protein